MTDPSPAPGDSPSPAHLSLARNPRALFALLAMPLFFATNLIVGRAVVGTVAPWSLAFWRWFFAAAMLLPFAIPALIGHRYLLAAQWKRILLLGLLGMVLCGGNVYAALETTTATNATLIYTTSTIMIVVMDAVLARRRLPLVQFIGTLAGFAGIALITVHGEPLRLMELEFNDGDLGILVAAVAWAAYSLMMRDGPLVRMGSVAIFATVAVAGTALLAPLALWEAANGGVQPHGLEAWSAIIFLAIFPSVLAFILFLYCVKVAGAPVTANFLYTLPVYGVLLAVLLLGEELHLYHAVGFVLVLGGVVLATYRPAATPR
jgi:drug/metabolite transporter (DMT)-like permease